MHHIYRTYRRLGCRCPFFNICSSFRDIPVFVSGECIGVHSLAAHARVLNYWILAPLHSVRYRLVIVTQFMYALTWVCLARSVLNNWILAPFHSVRYSLHSWYIGKWSKTVFFSMFCRFCSHLRAFWKKKTKKIWVRA